MAQLALYGTIKSPQHDFTANVTVGMQGMMESSVSDSWILSALIRSYETRWLRVSCFKSDDNNYMCILIS